MIIEADVDGVDHTRNDTQEREENVDAQVDGASTAQQDSDWLKNKFKKWRKI